MEYNPSKAIELLTKACDGQVLQGCSDLGFVYGKEGDFDKALGPVTKACNARHMQGCSRLGLLYYYGKGIQRDEPRAGKLFIKSCDRGFNKSCDILKERY